MLYLQSENAVDDLLQLAWRPVGEEDDVQLVQLFERGISRHQQPFCLVGTGFAGTAHLAASYPQLTKENKYG